MYYKHYGNKTVVRLDRGDEIIEKLRNTDINKLTPFEAMQKLYELCALAE